MPKYNSRGFASILLILFVILAAVSGIFYYGVKNGNLLHTYDPALDTTKQFDEQLRKEQNGETSNWKTFTSLDGSISFKYPQTWYYERDEFEGDNGVRFFSVTVTPKYSESENPGNEEFILFLLDDKRTLDELIGEGDPKIMVGGKDAFIDNHNYLPHTSVQIKPSADTALSLWFRSKDSQQYWDSILSSFKFGNKTKAAHCTPGFKVEEGPELTASQAYAEQCYQVQTRDACETVDIYNANTQSFGSGDNIMDCKWGYD